MPCLSLLTDEAAIALAEHKGELAFGGLTDLSDAAAISLAEHRGAGLHLSGTLKSLSDGALTALAKRELGGNDFSGFEDEKLQARYEEILGNRNQIAHLRNGSAC